MLDIWWRYLKTRKQKPWGNMQGHKACNQQPSHESNKETPTLPPSHLLTKSIQVSFSFTIWPQCASKVVPPARSPQKVISKTSFIFLKCSGSQFSGGFGFKFASLFPDFLVQEVGPKDFHETLGFFYEKSISFPFSGEVFWGFRCTWLETLPKKTWGVHFSVTPSYTLSYHHHSWNPKNHPHVLNFFQLSTVSTEKNHVSKTCSVWA